MLNNIRFRHHFLSNGCILTVATQLNYDTRDVSVGWAVFNANDSTWVKKIGNELAVQRLEHKTLTYTLSQCEPINCDLISLKALQIIICGTPYDCVDEGNVDVNNHPYFLPDPTRYAIMEEISRILVLFARRCGINYYPL